MSAQLKLSDDKLVPAYRFNLAAGMPSTVLKTVNTSAISAAAVAQPVLANPADFAVLATAAATPAVAQPAPISTKAINHNFHVIAHPVLRAYYLNEEFFKQLPVVINPNAVIFDDRYDANLKWYMPEFSIKDPRETNELLHCEKHEVKPTERDPNGIDTMNGTITFTFTRKKPQQVELEELLKANTGQKFKPVPVDIKEAKLVLTSYNPDIGADEKKYFSGTVMQDTGKIKFALKDNFFALAYNNMAKGDKAEMILLGDYDGWNRLNNKEKKNIHYLNKYPKTSFQSHIKTIRAPEVATTKAIADKNGAGVEFAKQRYIVEKVFPVSYSCIDYNNLYTWSNQGSTHAMGCLPPWSPDIKMGKMYEQKTLPKINEFATVFESLAEPNKFLVIPHRYVITRNVNNLMPAAFMNSALNPEEESENNVMFYFAVAPDISGYQYYLLKQELYAETSTLQGVPQPPVIVFPSDLAQSEELNFSNPLFSSIEYAPDGVNYLITLQCKDLVAAAQVVPALTTGSLSGKFNFKIDNGIEKNAGLLLDLNRTNGEVLEINAAPGLLHLKNLCESPIRVKGFILFNEGKAAYQLVNLPAIIPVASGQTVPCPLDGFPGTFQHIKADYEIDEVKVGENGWQLERRIEVDLLSPRLSVTTDINPVSNPAPDKHISKLYVEINFEIINTIEHCELIPVNDSFQDVNQIVDFVLPLDKYLHPNSRNIQYRVTFHYKDNTSKLIDWIPYNIGNNSYLNISRNLLA